MTPHDPGTSSDCPGKGALVMDDRILSKALSYALSGKNLDAAWEIWDIRPDWAARLLTVGTPYASDGDRWKEPCAWDDIPDIPPDVVLEMRSAFGAGRERRRRDAFLRRCRKRDLKAAFGVA